MFDTLTSYSVVQTKFVNFLQNENDDMTIGNTTAEK